MKRFFQATTVLAIAALSYAGIAGATVTSPPTVDGSDLNPIIYAVGAALLAAILVVFGPILLTKVPFAIVNLINRAVHRLMGRSRPSVG